MIAYSVEYKYRIGKGEIDLSSHTFKCALMSTSFEFDPVNHGTWSDVSGSEIPEGNGYASGGQEMTLASYGRDDANERAVAQWENVEWTASGGDIGPAKGCIIYDASVADLPIVGFIEFAKNPDGSYPKAVDEARFVVRGLEVRNE